MQELTETLAGGPPSADLTYVLSEAKSAIVFALAFDQNLIDPYFKPDSRSQNGIHLFQLSSHLSS
jgi:epoxyqueuosine reductase QueG